MVSAKLTCHALQKEDKAEEPKVVGKGKGKEVLDETLDDDEEMGDLEDY